MCTATLVTGRAHLWTFATLIVLVACAGNPEAPLDIIDPDQQPGGGTTVSGDLTGQLPVAVIDASVTAGIVPVSVRFNAAGSWSTLGAIAAYAWDFGDGSTSDAVEVYHTFVEPGTYAVQLTVYDNLGQAGSAVVEIVALPPVQIVCTPATASGPAPLSVELMAATIGGGASLPADVQYRWDFGDSSQGTGSSVVHVYRQPGRYVVTLTLAVGLLLVPGDSIPIVVDVAAGGDNQPPVADAGPNQVIVDDDGDGSALVPLDGRGSHDPDGTIVWYRWTLESGPGAPIVLAEGSAPLRQVPLPLGEYDITLTVTDNEQATGQDTTKAAIIVAAILDVSPADDFSSAGPLGGPFTPSETAYTLRNTGQQPLVWAAGAGQAWVTLSHTGGTLAAGGADVVTVTINPGAIALGTGVHKDTVTFANLTSSAGTTSRIVELTVTDPTLPLIAGRVTVGGSGLAGVVMNGLPGNPSTNANGDYFVSVAYGWSGTVTPSKAGYTFSPVSRTYSNVTANQTSQNYAATLQTYTVSGRVSAGGSGLAGVVMNGLPTTPTTNANGDYTASVPYGWSATVTPSKAGYTFSPVSRTYNNVTANQAAQNYTATLQTYTINGRVTEGGSGLAGVVMNGLPTPPTTNASGDYTASVPYGWSGTVTPSKAGYTFSPVSRTYNNITANQAAQNYTATLQTYTVSGRVTVDGSGLAGVVMNGLPTPPTTNANGDYTASVPYGWSGTVTPSKDGYAFTPVNRAYSNVTSHQAGQDYTGTPSQQQMASQISQYGITWTFDRPYRVGQFVNGDWWVCPDAPGENVMVVDITRPHRDHPDDQLDGSQINPTVAAQGYDSREWSCYDNTVNVALMLPLTLTADQSLVSAISWVEGEPGCPPVYSGRPRPLLRIACVLTCLGAPPPADAFRPSPYGADKTLYRTSDLHWDRLASLAPVGVPPTLESLETKFEKFRLDQMGHYSPVRLLVPSEARPDYGADLCIENSNAALRLCLNDAQTQKQTLMIRYVQYGIDLHGAACTGTRWRANGGHGPGRKLPILFAGRMLDEATMLAIGQAYPASDDKFAEDSQTWYVNEGDVGRPLRSNYAGTAQGGSATTITFADDHPATYPHWISEGRRIYLVGGTGAGQMRVATAFDTATLTATVNPAWNTAPDATTQYEVRGYEADHVGMPEFGIRHAAAPTMDCPTGPTAEYRGINSNALRGTVLAARILGLRTAWNHDALFDYMDRYYALTEPGGAWNPRPSGYQSAFAEAMWAAYRAQW